MTLVKFILIATLKSLDPKSYFGLIKKWEKFIAYTGVFQYYTKHNFSTFKKFNHNIIFTSISSLKKLILEHCVSLCEYWNTYK